MSLNVLIIGGGAIANALAERIVAENEKAHCLVLYRQNSPQVQHSRVNTRRLDATQEHEFITLKECIRSDFGRVHWVINTVGILHDAAQNIQPEKRLRDINAAAFLRVMEVNVLPTLYAAKHWADLFDQSQKNIFAVISAKVGSIADNRLGGWHSYRASKASLNMIIKNIALEYALSNKQLCVLALHPGTTDSALSAPFQRNVPPEKLFSPQRTAMQLLRVIQRAEPCHSGRFLNWDGERLPW